MIDTFELYILILICVTLTLIQGHRGARKHNVHDGSEWNLIYYPDMVV